jgi:hypothetical protein
MIRVGMPVFHQSGDLQALIFDCAKPLKTRVDCMP